MPPLSLRCLAVHAGSACQVAASGQSSWDNSLSRHELLFGMERVRSGDDIEGAPFRVIVGVARVQLWFLQQRGCLPVELIVQVACPLSLLLRGC